MKNVRVRVVNSCSGDNWWYAVCEGRRELIIAGGYGYKSNAIRAAKSMAKRIGIKFDPEIIKKHGC